MSGIGTFFARLFPKSLGQRQTGKVENGPRPLIDVAVIGDIHGRYDLLAEMLDQLDRDYPDHYRVFVGDYCDRGPDTRAVLNRLIDESRRATCLMGNHEAMLLEFLDDPVANGGRWLRNGGAETLQSFDLSIEENPSVQDLRDARDAFATKLFEDGAEDWLRSRPLIWQSGNLLVNHAGPDPAVALDEQEEQNFLWGHPRFLRDERTDGLWVAHGHWARERTQIGNGRIAVDTGAYKSGRLSAAIISTDGDVRFTRA